MKKYIIVGLGFGDEGKGTAVDYLSFKSQKHNNDVFNIKFCGGYQAAHNVVLPNGNHFCFHQIGSGALHSAKTVLTRNFITEPVSLCKEIADLNKKFGIYAHSRIYVHSQSLVATPYHILLNQAKEEVLRHGSCGMGIGETRRYWLKYGNDAVVAGDINNKTQLYSKLELLRQRTIDEFINHNNTELRHYNNDYLDKIFNVSNQRIITHMEDAYRYKIINEFACNTDDVLIFEGSQGILLDENFGFIPNNTWSTVTSKHALDFMNEQELSINNTEIIGVTRTHISRHGGGPLPTYNHTIEINNDHNNANQWQGYIRYGYLDYPLLQYAIKANNGVDSVFITHCDQQPHYICKNYEENYNNPQLEPIAGSRTSDELINVQPNITRGHPLNFLKNQFKDKKLYLSSGPTYLDKEEINAN